ncbi:hypothetical protein ACFL5X_03430 [Candidatus Omnitrophota bacterium]
MEFTLIYKGSLESNGSLKEKQAIRRVIHPQLKKLWTYPPLKGFTDENHHYLSENPPPNKISIIQRIGFFNFAPLINQKLHLFAEVNIIWLRPEAPGCIITQGGDIDNRLKTLFDAFRMPRNQNEIPTGDSPRQEEIPFHCLLEDDNLITKISIKTDTLLTPCDDSSYVELLMWINIKATIPTFGNVGIA